MAEYVFLDAGPLGLACKGVNNPKAEKCREWMAKLRSKGFVVVIPAIADYEVRREFLRSGNEDWLRQLDALAATSLLEITQAALVKAAEFWALLRNAGQATASSNELDADAILAAQAVTAANPGDRVIIATTNTKHLGRFPGVNAQSWDYVD